MSSGPRECTDSTHPHVLMCPVQATAIASVVVMAGMARREDGIGNVWWGLGLNELRFADAEAAVRDLVAGGIGDRSWITARDVIRRVKRIRADRHERAPAPVPPDGLDAAGQTRFLRWYWTAIGNGETPGTALELAAGGIGADRYIAPVPPDTGEEVEPATIDTVRGVLEQARRKEQGRG